MALIRKYQITIHIRDGFLVEFDVWELNSFRQFWCLCLVWDFRPAIDLHSSPQRVSTRELADEVASMTDRAFIFSLNTLTWILSNFLIILCILLSQFCGFKQLARMYQQVCKQIYGCFSACSNTCHEAGNRLESLEFCRLICIT